MVGGLSERQWVVMDYTDQMTREVKVSDAIFHRLKAHFEEREIVEITATVAAYNCVSRFLVALDVGEMNEGDGLHSGKDGGQVIRPSPTEARNT